MIRIGIIGTGRVANAHVKRFHEIRGCRIVACCDIDPARAEAFAQRDELGFHCTDFNDLLAEEAIDAVAVATTDAVHAPASIAAAKAGKHVLCEKPLAVDYPEARKMVRAVHKAGVVNAVNFSYRNAPAIHHAARLVAAGDVGRVMHVKASYLQTWLSAAWRGDWRTDSARLWRLSTAHGSMGVLGDIGVHILDFATYPVGPVKSVQCRLKTFPKAPGNRIGEYRLDANDSALLTVEFKCGAMGQIDTTRWATGHGNHLMLGIYGDEGAIEVDLDRSRDSLRVCRGRDKDKCAWKELNSRHTPNNHSQFIRAIGRGQPDGPEFPSFARGAEVQKVLDACFASDESSKPVKV